MRRLLLAALVVGGLLASPAEANHGGGWHWPSSNRHLDVVDILVHFIPAESRDTWREYRDQALADWSAVTGVFTYSISESRTKKQRGWDGICMGRGATKAVGVKDVMLCRHGDWAAQAAPRYATTCNVTDADFPARCHLETGGLIAINEGFATWHPKYIKHEMGHMLGLYAERSCPDISVMSYCDGSLLIDEHDRELVVSAHRHPG